MNLEKLQGLLEQLQKCDKEYEAIRAMLARPGASVGVLGSPDVYLCAADIRDALLERRKAITARRHELVAEVRML